jgi:hypothetical protein
MRYLEIKRFTFFLLCALITSNLLSQSNVKNKCFYNPAISEGRINAKERKTYIQGNVYDDASKEPLIGAIVKLKPTGTYCYTDLNGYFEFMDLPPDTFSLEVSYLGYKKTTFTNVSTTDKQIVNLVLTLQLQINENEKDVIDSEAPKFSELYAISLQKNSNFIFENTPATQIDKDNFDYSIATSFKRMNSAALEENKTFIRGLPEKYNAVLLNRAPLISLDPQQIFYPLHHLPASLFSKIQISKSTTSEFYGNYAGGAIELDTEKMPLAPHLKFQWNAFYHPYTTFKKLSAFPTNRNFLFIPETHNIKIQLRSFALPSKPFIPNYFKNHPYTALPATQWNAYLANRLTAFNNKELGLVLALSFSDFYHKKIVAGSNLSHHHRGTLFFNPIRLASQDVHTQNFSAIANASINWNLKNKFYSQNFITYKNENLVYSQTTDYEYFKNQSFIRNFIFAQQNSGEHILVAKKDRSLRLEWSQFYHYYYQQTPASIAMNFQKNASNDMNLQLPNASNIYLDKDYQKNLIYADKQQVHQLGGDAFFDVMVKEDDNKAKTRIGAFINWTSSLFNSRKFLYQLNTPLLDSSFLSINNILTNGLTEISHENLLELTDTTNFFTAQNLNFAPYINIQYELTDVFHLVFGFREDFSFRQIANFNNQNLKTLAMQSDLPSVSVIFKTNEKSQFRFHYMMTVARPSDRDWLGASYFHPLTQILQLPNPNAMTSTINHVDARYESFTTPSDAFSVNLFFKHLHLPLEHQYNIPAFSSQVLTMATTNANAAILGGLEMEWKQNIGKLIPNSFFEMLHIQWNGYASFSNTKTKHEYEYFTEFTRPLQGHSNYGSNLGLNWTHPKLGLKVQSYFHHKGKSIFLANSDNKKWDIWELQRTDGTFQISKIYQAHWEFRLACFNLFNQPIRWAFLQQTHYFKNKISQTFREQKLGRQFLFSVNYRW